MPKRFDYALKMQALRDARGGRCECGCGRTTMLEFAHLVETKVFGRGRGRPTRYHDIKNNPGAYTLLAKPCHQRQERQRAAQRLGAGPVLQSREPGDDTGEEDV